MLSRPTRFLFPLILGAVLLAVALISALASSSSDGVTNTASKYAQVGRVTATPVIRTRTRGHINYLLSKSSSVSVRLQRLGTGRQLGSGRCQRRTSRNRRGKPCTYFGGTVAKRSVRGKRGSNRLSLRKRFGGKTLRNGIYRVTVRARGGSLRQAVFTVK